MSEYQYYYMGSGRGLSGPVPHSIAEQQRRLFLRSHKGNSELLS